jgi:hypothetical protein
MVRRIAEEVVCINTSDEPLTNDGLIAALQVQRTAPPDDSDWTMSDRSQGQASSDEDEETLAIIIAGGAPIVAEETAEEIEEAKLKRDTVQYVVKFLAQSVDMRQSALNSAKLFTNRLPTGFKETYTEEWAEELLGGDLEQSMHVAMNALAIRLKLISHLQWRQLLKALTTQWSHEVGDTTEYLRTITNAVRSPGALFLSCCNIVEGPSLAESADIVTALNIDLLESQRRITQMTRNRQAEPDKLATGHWDKKESLQQLKLPPGHAQVREYWRDAEARHMRDNGRGDLAVYSYEGRKFEDFPHWATRDDVFRLLPDLAEVKPGPAKIVKNQLKQAIQFYPSLLTRRD